jgi:hypothetical protein
MSLISRYFIAIALFSACSSQQPKKVVVQDFDSLQEWGVGNNVVTDKGSRSGKFSAFTDSNHEYTETYRTDYSRLLLSGYTKVKVSAWYKTLVPDPDCSLVISIEKGDQKLAYKAVQSKDVKLKMNEWIQITNELIFPAENVPESLIKIYTHSPQKQEILVDDMQIEYY